MAVWWWTLWLIRVWSRAHPLTPEFWRGSVASVPELNFSVHPMDVGLLARPLKLGTTFVVTRNLEIVYSVSSQRVLACALVRRRSGVQFPPAAPSPGTVVI